MIDKAEGILLSVVGNCIVAGFLYLTLFDIPMMTNQLRAIMAIIIGINLVLIAGILPVYVREIIKTKKEERTEKRTKERNATS